jgi:BlaI family transcriptional regulator, penicillinase repressor
VSTPVAKPTEGELGILHVLWRRGPSTVREVWEDLKREKDTTYTTTLKLLQIMTEKGLVERDEAARSHVYRTRFSREQTQRRLVGDLLERAFGGSARQLVVQALAHKKASRKELRELEALLDRIEGGER